MQLYTGIDLHSSNSYLAIIDETGKRVFKKKYPNDPEQILSALAPYKDAITGIVIESRHFIGSGLLSWCLPLLRTILLTAVAWPP
jgi:predicted NBD/HSP70 family sugar kinase